MRLCFAPFSAHSIDDELIKLDVSGTFCKFSNVYTVRLLKIALLPNSIEICKKNLRRCLCSQEKGKIKENNSDEFLFQIIYKKSN
jgi:hypothetical protein